MTGQIQWEIKWLKSLWNETFQFTLYSKLYYFVSDGMTLNDYYHRTHIIPTQTHLTNNFLVHQLKLHSHGDLYKSEHTTINTSQLHVCVFALFMFGFFLLW